MSTAAPNANADPSALEVRLLSDLETAEAKAWDSLAKYKFWMFGYWAADWVRLNRRLGLRRPNPFARLVLAARAHLSEPAKS